jgi:hypothetical protein
VLIIILSIKLLFIFYIYYKRVNLNKYLERKDNKKILNKKEDSKINL